MSWRCRNASTRSIRLRRELTFQVAMRTRRDYARRLTVRQTDPGEATGPVPAAHARRRPRQRPAPAGRAPAVRRDRHPRDLRAAMRRLARLEVPPQVIVFTGDLADRAEPKAYVRLREIVEPAAAELGAEVVWVMGNHDEREHYARELFGETATDEAHPGPGPRGRRAPGGRARHDRARLPPRRAHRRPARLARRRAVDARAARDAGGAAPPADPGADDAGGGDRSSCTTSTSWPR